MNTEGTEAAASRRPGIAASRRALQAAFDIIERPFDRLFGPRGNPFGNLGALGFFFYWIVAVSGIYIYIFFDTGTTEAWESVEYMTRDQWYLAGVMRSLHRYASDGLVLVMVVHILREFALDRYRGRRWFSWILGIPVFVLVFVSGITGYWLVWDTLAQYIALVSTEWLDWLPIFGEPIARNFLSPQDLDDRFFSLMIFIHIAAPLFLLFAMWIHIQRVSRAVVNPPRELAIGSFIMMLVLSLVYPAVSHPPADLGLVIAEVRPDWYYLAIYPLIDTLSHGTVWGVVAVLTLVVAVMPWLPPLRRAPAAVVDLENCNGCQRCADDCPYDAVRMERRSDGAPFAEEAVVDADKCVACGICTGACPVSTPFRRIDPLVTGIDMPSLSLETLREQVIAAGSRLQGGRRIIVFGCDHGPRPDRLGLPDVAGISLPCIGMLPPAFIDFVISRNHADGVFLTGCREDACYNREGIAWTKQRIAGTRDPALRRRVPRERLAMFWAGITGKPGLVAAVAEFAAGLPETGEKRRAAPAPATGDPVREGAG